MPREDLSPEIIEAMMGRETGIVALFLMDIDHEDLDEPIRLVNNTEDVISEGNTYTAMGFVVTLPEDRDNTPRGAQIKIDNTTQWFTPTFRSLSGDFFVTIKIAIASDIDASPPIYDGVEIEYLPSQLIALDSNATTVTGTLTYENLANAIFPGDTFNPFDFPGAF